MTDRDIMQQALDALRQCEFTSPPAQRQIVKNALAALNERLAQPEQEPVACPYCHNSATLGSVYYDQNCVGCVKRMTTPPRRKPLTVCEIVDAIQPFYQNRGFAEMAVKVRIDDYRAIEAKLKERNT